MNGQQKAQPLSHPDKTAALIEQVTVRAPDSVWAFGEDKRLVPCRDLNPGLSSH